MLIDYVFHFFEIILADFACGCVANAEQAVGVHVHYHALESLTCGQLPLVRLAVGTVEA